MKVFFTAPILALMFCAASSAQTNQTVVCPSIAVNGPALTRPGETAVFNLIISKEVERYKVEYEWAVSVGEIIEGQGTTIIKAVQKPEDIGSNFTAFIEVKGLPENCPANASETAPLYDPPRSTEIDEFTISATQVDKVKLSSLANIAQNNPSAQIYIIEKFAKKTSPKLIKLKNQKTIDYLKLRGIERDSITLINAFGDENMTRFILVPAGALRPTFDDCILIEPN